MTESTTSRRIGVEMTRVVATRNDENSSQIRPSEEHEKLDAGEEEQSEHLPSTSNHSTGSQIAESAKHALHRFFYPPAHVESPKIPSPPSFDRPEQPYPQTPTSITDSEDDRAFVHHFWTTYDDILILSIFTQIGIVFRLAASSWFARFDNVFSKSSPLFVNLPLNCLSCFVMGILCSGERCMEVIGTRFTPARTQQPPSEEQPNKLRQRRKQKFHSWQPPVQLQQDLRDVQLMALERRIRLSKCLLLFPLKKEDVDVMEHYFDRGYRKKDPLEHLDDLVLREGDTDDEEEAKRPTEVEEAPTPILTTPTIFGSSLQEGHRSMPPTSSDSSLDNSEDSAENAADTSYIVDFTSNVQENVTANVERFNRLQSNTLFIDGWDTGTTVNDMSDDLLLGLRDGFCGALSSFSSWNSSMVALLRQAEFSKAFMGYILGVQLPIISYRFGQHVAVYIFVWRTRRETRIAERRGGYGIRIAQEEELPPRRIPSLRAVFTALFVVAVAGQIASIFLYSNVDDQQIALSLLFSPLGVLARWRLSRWNTWKPTFPLGTLIANWLACALSGSLGSLLAGNPGPEERTVLVSIVAGFGGTLSSLATFVVEILAGIDPILFRFDGISYALVSIAGAIVIGFIMSASVEWADETVLASQVAASLVPSMVPSLAPSSVVLT